MIKRIVGLLTVLVVVVHARAGVAQTSRVALQAERDRLNAQLNNQSEQLGKTDPLILVANQREPAAADRLRAWQNQDDAPAWNWIRSNPPDEAGKALKRRIESLHALIESLELRRDPDDARMLHDVLDAQADELAKPVLQKNWLDCFKNIRDGVLQADPQRSFDQIDTPDKLWRALGNADALKADALRKSDELRTKCGLPGNIYDAYAHDSAGILRVRTYLVFARLHTPEIVHVWDRRLAVVRQALSEEP